MLRSAQALGILLVELLVRNAVLSTYADGALAGTAARAGWRAMLAADREEDGDEDGDSVLAPAGSAAVSGTVITASAMSATERNTRRRLTCGIIYMLLLPDQEVSSADCQPANTACLSYPVRALPLLIRAAAQEQMLTRPDRPEAAAQPRQPFRDPAREPPVRPGPLAAVPAREPGHHSLQHHRLRTGAGDVAEEPGKPEVAS
jgi:hypothetical protein